MVELRVYYNWGRNRAEYKNKFMPDHLYKPELKKCLEAIAGFAEHMRKFGEEGEPCEMNIKF
jgi:hypothetical protein